MATVPQTMRNAAVLISVAGVVMMTPATAKATVVVSRSGERIIAVDRDGRERVVTVGQSPSISPDGRRVAFYRGARDEGGFDLRVVSPRGGRSRVLARRIRTESFEPTQVTWFPDSRRMVVGGSQLVIANVDGRIRRYRTRIVDEIFGVTFAPGSRRVAFLDYGLRIVDLRTGARETVRRGGFAASWSRFGLAYTHVTRDSDPRTGLRPQGRVLLRAGRARSRVALSSFAQPLGWTPRGRVLIQFWDETLAFLDPRTRAYKRSPAKLAGASIVQISRDGRRALAIDDREGVSVALEFDLLTGTTSVRARDVDYALPAFGPSWNE